MYNRYHAGLCTSVDRQTAYSGTRVFNAIAVDKARDSYCSFRKNKRVRTRARARWWISKQLTRQKEAGRATHYKNLIRRRLVYAFKKKNNFF